MNLPTWARLPRGLETTTGRFVGCLAGILALLAPVVSFAEPATPIFSTVAAISEDKLQPYAQCKKHTLHTHTNHPDINASIDGEIAELQLLIEQALTYREETIAVGHGLKEKIRRGLPLSGSDLHHLNHGTAAHLELRQRLIHIAKQHECWLDMTQTELEIAGLTPATQLKGIMMSLSSALVLYDNYLLAISIFEEDDKLRRFINQHDTGYKIREAELAKITLSYNSVDNRRRVRKAINFYEQNIGKYEKELTQDAALQYFNLLIRQSPSYEMTKAYSPLFVLGRKFDFYSAITTDTLHSLATEGVSLFSMLFGNAVGLIEERKGKLYQRPDVVRSLTSSLKAGDILLEKTPFRLTDSFIPGHWGHAALWIGTEEELRALGIWDHDLVRKHHKSIRKGSLIVEALRSGVQMSTLAKFSNVDDLAILRDQEASSRDRADIILLALRQVGKAYDFNFDIETTDRIVCSELVYMTYTHIDWPTDNTLGRATISPDNIAQKAVEGDRLEIVTIFHDGRPVDHRLTQTMSALIGI